ncbi:MAG: hypothetical protein ACOZBH_00175 [Patescibacteria group bacterium]
MARFFSIMKVACVIACPLTTHFLLGGWMWTLFGVVLGCVFGLISKAMSDYFYSKYYGCCSYETDVYPPAEGLIYLVIGLPALMGCINLGIYDFLIWLGAGQSLIYIVMVPIGALSSMIAFFWAVEPC